MGLKPKWWRHLIGSPGEYIKTCLKLIKQARSAHFSVLFFNPSVTVTEGENK